MKQNRKRFLILPMVLLAAVTGCSVPKPPTLAEVETKHLAFLELNRTTREDILVRLGTPSSVFENERILTYRLRLDPEQGFANSPYAFYQYGLTFVFDRDGRLSNYNLRKH